MAELTTSMLLNKVQELLLDASIEAQEEFKNEVLDLSDQLDQTIRAEQIVEKDREEAYEALQVALHEKQQHLEEEKEDGLAVLKKFQPKFDHLGIDLGRVDPDIVNWTQAVHRAQGGMGARSRAEFYSALNRAYRYTGFPYGAKDQKEWCPNEYGAFHEADIRLCNVRREADALEMKICHLEPPEEVLELPEDLSDLPEEILRQLTDWLEEKHPQAIEVVEKAHLGAHWKECKIDLPGLTFEFTLE